PYASVAEEEQAREEAAAAQLRIWRAHLPEIFEKMSRIADPHPCIGCRPIKRVDDAGIFPEKRRMLTLRKTVGVRLESTAK
ncbi:MAG: hypothetical protein M0Z36_01535, partial [Thermaerobacter sp.]|nr:hypothetical protein [Thermaerobacter sp.]